jgi:hypothetical protein
MFYGLWLALLGVLAASNLIIAKRPDAAEAIAKFAPYQGWMGALSIPGGILAILAGLGLLGVAPIIGIVELAVGVVQTLLGFLLGVGVLKTFIKAPDAQAKLDQTMAKLSPKQGLLGLVGIGLGLALVVLGFVL